jgi:hypothetical protein
MNRGSYLEHLDEGDREEEVGSIAEHQAQAEEDADWNDCSEVHSSSHRHLLAGVKDSRKASHALRYSRRENKMPCCEKYC